MSKSFAAGLRKTCLITAMLGIGFTAANAAKIPGLVQAEDYNPGKKDIAYSDKSKGNSGKAGIKKDDVDIAGSGANLYLTNTEAGEWLTYTLDVSEAGYYDIALHAASGTNTGSLQLQSDGQDITGNLLVPFTGSASTWSDTKLSYVFFAKGIHVLRANIKGAGFNLDYFSFSRNYKAEMPGKGFLKTQGKFIVNQSGTVNLKGTNLGNWMLQEGYMMQSTPFAPSQHELKDRITALVGPEATQKFYSAWLTNYTTKADIDSIAKWGYNSIRIPYHYNLFTPRDVEDSYTEIGFALTDSVIAWCRPHGIYVIPDLHACPGGQSRDNIADYDTTRPAIWDTTKANNAYAQSYRTKFLRFWKYFAQRYANEPLVAGYDVMNEPVQKMNKNDLLLKLYKEVTAEIRSVDTKHIIFIEGNWYATNFENMTPPWDNNMVYSFHKYWNSTHPASIGWITKIMNEHNVPLWCGEFGENGNQWIIEAVAMYDTLHIGWCAWPYKKLESTAGPVTIKRPESYKRLLEYWKGKAPKPSVAEAEAALADLVEASKLKNCHVNKDYSDALLRASQTKETKPFANLVIPGTIQLADFDMGADGYAYHDKLSANKSEKPGQAVNNGHSYRNDGIDIYLSKEDKKPVVGWTDDGEWMKYTATVKAAGKYAVNLRYAGAKSGNVSFITPGQTKSDSISLPATGSDSTFSSVTLLKTAFPQGVTAFTFKVNKGGVNLSTFEIMPAVEPVQTPTMKVTGPADKKKTKK